MGKPQAVAKMWKWKGENGAELRKRTMKITDADSRPVDARPFTHAQNTLQGTEVAESKVANINVFVMH